MAGTGNCNVYFDIFDRKNTYSIFTLKATGYRTQDVKVYKYQKSATSDLKDK